MIAAISLTSDLVHGPPPAAVRLASLVPNGSHPTRRPESGRLLLAFRCVFGWLFLTWKSINHSRLRKVVPGRTRVRSTLTPVCVCVFPASLPFNSNDLVPKLPLSRGGPFNNHKQRLGGFSCWKVERVRSGRDRNRHTTCGREISFCQCFQVHLVRCPPFHSTAKGLAKLNLPPR